MRIVDGAYVPDSPLDFEIANGTYDPNAGQLLDWSFYDRVTIGTNTKYRFFIDPVGSTTGKTFAETNFPIAGQMPADVHFRVDALAMYWTPKAAKSQANYQIFLTTLKNSFFEFGIGSKSPQYQEPMDMFFDNPVPMVVIGGAAGDQLMSRTQYSVMRNLEPQIVLAGKTTFSVDVTFNSTPDASIQAEFLGFKMIGKKLSK